MRWTVLLLFYSASSLALPSPDFAQTCRLYSEEVTHAYDLARASVDFQRALAMVDGASGDAMRPLHLGYAMAMGGTPRDELASFSFQLCVTEALDAIVLTTGEPLGATATERVSEMRAMRESVVCELAAELSMLALEAAEKERPLGQVVEGVEFSIREQPSLAFGLLGPRAVDYLRDSVTRSYRAFGTEPSDTISHREEILCGVALEADRGNDPAGPHS